VGCGVGIISLLLSRDFDIKTSIIDKQEKMLSCAKHNYMLNGLSAQNHLGDFILFKTEEKFDYIISNPPFYDSNVTQSEDTHLNIARYAHHLPIVGFIAKVKKLLKPRGYFIFCYDAKQVDILLQVLRKQGINPEKMQFVHSKIDRDSKLVMIVARVGYKSMMQVQQHYLVFDYENVYTKKPQDAF
jgi:tRNA1(Val) A37 N6-methylase TrmN6